MAGIKKSQSLSKITDRKTHGTMAPEILIIRLSALGDVVHTLPVAAAIKRYKPEAKITWVVERLAAPLLLNNPAVDRVIVFPGKSLFKKKPAPSAASTKMVASASAPLGLVLSESLSLKSAASVQPEAPPEANPLKAIVKFWREFKSYKYDIAIDAQGLFKSALLCWLSGAKFRIGFAHTRECADKFLTHPIDVGDYFGPNQHIVDLNLRLIVKLFETIGINVPATWLSAQFPLPVVPEDVKERVESWLSFSKTTKESAGNLILIPGTTWDAKIWPLAKWQELGKLLLSNNNYQLLICGGNSDLITNKQLEDHLISSAKHSVLNLTGRTNLLELIALFERAQIVIGADSGPIHLACAVGKPKVIGIMGSTPWKRNGPYGKNGLSIALNLDCQPCFQKTCPLHTLACLNDLSAQHVYDEIMDFVEP
jgi:ADP-heptose:LPS heptosyltransferase